MAEKSVVPISTDQRRAVRDYVGQLKDMEIEKLKFKRLNDELSVKKDEVIAEAEKREKQAEDERDKKRAYYQESLRIIHQKPTFVDRYLLFYGAIFTILGCLAGLIIQWILVGIILLILEQGFEINLPEVVEPILRVSIIIIGGIVGFIIILKFGIDDYKFEKKKNAERVSGLQQDEKNLKDAEQYTQKCIEGIETAKMQSQTIEKQINLNEQNITQIDLLIKKMHSFDIIPPDYRTADCIITLDHIFKNDLADTVRDAVLLYKDWVYHETIIVGIENIYQMLGNLSASMQYMQRTLDSIDQNVSAMADDMTRMIGLQKESNRTQEQILRESQCTREATESIRRSNEKYEWYAEQHRQGLF